MPDEKKPSFFQRWGKVHRERKATGKRFRNEYFERSAEVSRLGHDADFKPAESFFEDQPGRREEGVAAGTVNDADLCWTVTWLPTTTEVYARAANWLDAETQEQVPDYVVLLGNASNEQQVRDALVRSYTLETLKDALYGAN